MEKLLSEVLEGIKPTPEEKEWEMSIAEWVKSRLRRVIPKNVEIEIVGSIAKNTDLRNDRDVDMFMLFPKGTAKSELVTKGLAYAKRAVSPHPWQIGYAEHPYLKAEVEGCTIELVPSFRITNINERASAVDRSPLHKKYILSKLDEKKCDEVRLLKQFLKRLGVYGAELRVEGFSGYLCELLIVHYGSFTELLKHSSNWSRPVIDIEGYHSEKEMRGKFNAPLIVVDPVDKNRNVAAAVSPISLSKFILASRAFLRKPSKGFFFSKDKEFSKKELSEKMMSRGTKFVALAFPAPKVVPDILWPQLRKAAGSIAKHLELSEFKLFGYDFWSDESKRCVVLLELSTYQLPAIRKAIGPAVTYEKDVGSFIRKHRNAVEGPRIEGDKVIAVERRDITDAIVLIKKIIKNPGSYAIPSHISKTIKKGYVLVDEDILKESFNEFVNSYLSKREFFINDLI
ncbi:MAG: CCA tRNA nucleotidyltransferase [Candidatus Micrarchaeota archaeon]|nr:CCA tRNA nucleotidyltransferase [Candidatus Micrarchaeota archaeon]